MGAVILLEPADVRAQGARDSSAISPIGKITELEGKVGVEHNAAVVVQASLSTAAPPKIGDSLYKGDVIQTRDDGKISLIFTDGTAFNLGRNARIELNEFVYDPNSTANTAKFSILKGALTFVAGAAARSGSMTVETNVGTMGIRGTTPRVEILNDGSVKFSTLVEDDKTPPAASPGTRPPASGQRQGRTDTTPEQRDPAYERFINLRPKICENC